MGKELVYHGMRAGNARAKQVVTLSAGTDTGPFMLEAKGFKNWFFTFFGNGTITGGSVTVYGTIDEATSGVMAPVAPMGYALPTFVSAGNWFPLLAPSEQAVAAASEANPVTVFNGTQLTMFNRGLYAVRLVANAYTGGGTISVEVLAID